MKKLFSILLVAMSVMMSVGVGYAADTTDSTLQRLQNRTTTINADTARTQAETERTNARTADIEADTAELEGRTDAAATLRSAAEQHRQAAEMFDQYANDISAQNAQDRTTVLPVTDLSQADCGKLMRDVNVKPDESKAKFEARDDAYIYDVLGCGIKTGDIKLWMVPYYIRYILEFILQIGGLVAVGGIIYGGYLYLFAGISDDKERGKKAILYAVGGIVLMMVAWAFVNIVVSVLTA